MQHSLRKPYTRTKRTILYFLVAALMAATLWHFPLSFGSDSGMTGVRYCVADASHINLMQSSYKYDTSFLVDSISVLPVSITAALIIALCLYCAFTPFVLHSFFGAVVVCALLFVYLIILGFYILQATDILNATVRPGGTSSCVFLALVLTVRLIHSIPPPKDEEDDLYDEESEDQPAPQS